MGPASGERRGSLGLARPALRPLLREATEAPVPLDLRVLRALRSPFEIDIYVWLTWRFFRLRKPVTIPWASLALQFGSRYTNPRHFKKRFLGYMRNIVDFYPEVRLESSAAGLVTQALPNARPAPTSEALSCRCAFGAEAKSTVG